MNRILLGIAEEHSQNMYVQNYYSHTDPDGATPFDRMTNAGYNYLMAGENMAGSTVATSATDLEDLMMVDAGTAGRGHRVNLLDLLNPYPCGSPPCAYSEVGVGYYDGGVPNGLGLTSLITEDFGVGNTGPFLLGVVYNDLNNNNFYDIGEGIAGIAITPSSGGYYAVSSSSGGYAIPVGTSGTITVTASGPGFGPVTSTVTLTGANVKLDFIAHSNSTTTQTSSVQTATSIANPPSILLNSIYASPSSTVDITGSGFSPSDTTCKLAGNAVGSFNCMVYDGTLSASFAVANVNAGSYTVTVIGSPAGDSASTILTVNLPASQTMTSTSTSTSLISTQTTTSTNQITTTTTSYTTSYSSSQESTVTNPLTTTTTTTSQTTTTNSPVTAPDFSLSASSHAINLAQSSTGDLTVSVQSIGSFNEQVHLEALGLPEGVGISFSPDTVEPSQGETIVSTVTLLVNRTVSTGTYPFMIVATSGAVTKDIPISLSVSGCLIATATFGSELAPEVQLLRDFRDYKVLKTFAGESFMVAFNAWYYSFSPGVAQYESMNPAMRSLVKIVIHPMIWILQVGSIVFSVFNFNLEAAAVISGITVSALLGIVYLSVPMMIARRKLSGKQSRAIRRIEMMSFLTLVGGLFIVIVSEVLKAQVPMMVGSSAVILSGMTTSALLTSCIAT
jgi:hypothetical protein